MNDPAGASRSPSAAGTEDLRSQVESWLRVNGDELADRVTELQKSHDTVVASRRAALNLMEDAIRSREELQESRAQIARELNDTKLLQRTSSLLIEDESGADHFQMILDAAVAIMSADWGGIQVLDSESDELHLIAWKNSQSDSAAFWQRVAAEPGGPCDLAFRRGERIIVPDATADGVELAEESRKCLALCGIKAFQSTPMTTRDGKVIGVISTHWCERHSPGERELALLDVLVRQASDVLLRRQAEEALRSSQAWIAGQKEAFQAAVNGAPLHESLGVLIRTVKRQLGADVHCGILLADREGRRLHPIVGTADDDRPHATVGLAVEAIRPMITAEIELEAGCEPWHWPPRDFVNRGLRLFPITSTSGKVIGALAFCRTESSSVTAREREDIADLTRAAEIIISKYQEAEERARAEASLRDLNALLDERVREQTESLRAGQERLRSLALELTRAEQLERKRIARVLHDDVQQLLVAAKLRTELALEDSQATARHIAVAHELIDEAVSATRDLSRELAPPVLHERGLGPALEWLAARLEKQHQLVTEVTLGANSDPNEESLRDLLFQCARELLLNVIKHARTPTAYITLRRAADEIELCVSDFGVGFDPKNSQADSFGLLHLRERLTPLGGRIELSTSPGNGTAVRVLVPASRSICATDITPVPTVADSVGKSHDTLRVLLVDDHQVLREGLRDLVSRESDLEVVGEAADGRLAIEAARQLTPDVIVMDINMPRLNGVDATRCIKREQPNVRIVGLSMHADEEMSRALLEAGADAYVVKSGPAKELLAAIRG